MGASESTDSGGDAGSGGESSETQVALSPAQIVEENNANLLTFLFLLMVLILALLFLSITVIWAFFPGVVNSNNNMCVTNSNTSSNSSNRSSGSGVSATANARKEPAFDSFGQWLGRIRTSNLPRGRPAPNPNPNTEHETNPNDASVANQPKTNLPVPATG
jgi:hypothetical protein